MDPLQRHESVREQMAHLESVNAHRGRFGTSRRPDLDENRGLAAADAGAAPLPPRLVRPAYALAPDVVCAQGYYRDFFAACVDGDVNQVASLVEELRPDAAALQYGLEVAASNNRPDAVQHLLRNGAILHSGVFERSVFNKNESIFDWAGERDPLPLVRVLVAGGWHPNQAWEAPVQRVPRTPLSYAPCLANKPLVAFLLAHGADPNLGRPPGAVFGSVPLDRRSGQVLNAAVGLWDPTLIDMLLDHGADPTYAHVLHSVARYHGVPNLNPEPMPFARRRPLAEHLLAVGAATIKDVRTVTDLHVDDRPAGSSTVTTPFAYACAAQDWQFAEWLLERGADPDMLHRQAFEPQWWMRPYFGPNDPGRVVELVERVAGRKYDESA